MDPTGDDNGWDDEEEVPKRYFRAHLMEENGRY